MRVELASSLVSTCSAGSKCKGQDKASGLQNRASSVGAWVCFVCFFCFVFFLYPAGWRETRDVRQPACLVSTPYLDNRSVERRMRPGKKNNQSTRGGAPGQFCVRAQVCVLQASVSACVGSRNGPPPNSNNWKNIG